VSPWQVKIKPHGENSSTLVNSWTFSGHKEFIFYFNFDHTGMQGGLSHKARIEEAGKIIKRVELDSGLWEWKSSWAEQNSTNSLQRVRAQRHSTTQEKCKELMGIIE
jgi:hypothetical protein